MARPPTGQGDPVVFIDAIMVMVKVRDGQVTNRPVYVAIGVTCNGERDILGLWAGDGGEGAKFWLAVLTEIKNRGVQDVCILVCDGLKGLPDSVTATWPLTIVVNADPKLTPLLLLGSSICRNAPGRRVRGHGQTWT